MLYVITQFVLKLSVPDAGTFLAGACRITGLHHEALDVPVKQTSVVIGACA